jgi:hypothetical protein
VHHEALQESLRCYLDFDVRDRFATRFFPGAFASRPTVLAVWNDGRSK